jgi:23S rRNA (adenine1618-N6)-methyltransferase
MLTVLKKMLSWETTYLLQMMRNNSANPKSKLHPRNKHQDRYDFKQLIACSPELAEFVRPNKYGDESIDFFSAQAVKELNRALLKLQYNVLKWGVPRGYLCPPIPGRADYIHYVADLLCSNNFGRLPNGKNIKCLDIGAGANCIYPIIGRVEYGWQFVGSEIDQLAIENATEIVKANAQLKGHIELRFQPNPKDIFYGILKKEECIDITICNPPFHKSPEEAEAGSARKVSNLTHKKVTNPTLNFGGQSNELWCDGGEQQFISKMIRESAKYSTTCFWFTSLIAKKTHLASAYKNLKSAGALEVKTIPMGQGNKTSRIIAWTFLDKKQQTTWKKERWK